MTYIYSGQKEVKYLGYNNLKSEITLQVAEKTIDFLFPHNIFDRVVRLVAESWNNGWGNNALAICMMNCEDHQVSLNHIASLKSLPQTSDILSEFNPTQEVLDVSRNTQDFKSAPDDEYRWTVIAQSTVSNALSYPNRQWFKDPKKAMASCVEVFDKRPMVKLVLVEADQLFGKKLEINFETERLRPTTKRKL